MSFQHGALLGSAELKIGCWTSDCCVRDLNQIRNEDELVAATQENAERLEDGMAPLGVYLSLQDAIEALVNPLDPDAVSYGNKLLKFHDRNNEKKLSVGRAG